MKRERNLIDGFEVLLTQIMEGITYAQFAQVPISNRNIVHIVIGVIMRCGLIADPYIKLHERADTVSTWLDFHPFWSAQLKMRRLIMVTADQVGYGMNAAKTAEGEVSEQQMNSFGQAHLARLDTKKPELEYLSRKIK